MTPAPPEEQTDAALAALLPGLRHLIAVAIRDAVDAAVLAERERCRVVILDAVATATQGGAPTAVFTIFRLLDERIAGDF